MDHKQRFMVWRKRMPEKTRYLVDRVLEKIIPEIEKHGFVWYREFQTGANVIPLQKKEGAHWPTVEIRFIPTGPFFKMEFSALPEFCQSPQEQDIPRARASVMAGPLYMILHRGVWRDHRDSEFGFSFLPLLFFSPVRFIRYKLDWRKFLDSEVDAALASLPYLFDVFDKKAYLEWMDHPFGAINKHIFLSMSWKIRKDMENARSSENSVKSKEIAISQDPLLNALDADISAANRKRDKRLLIALLLATAGIFFAEYFTTNIEWIGVTLSAFCIGFIVYTIIWTARDKQNIAVKYGLACARCGHKPDAHMVISAAITRHCAKCGAWLDAQTPSEHGE